MHRHTCTSSCLQCKNLAYTTHMHVKSIDCSAHCVCALIHLVDNQISDLIIFNDECTSNRYAYILIPMHNVSRCFLFPSLSNVSFNHFHDPHSPHHAYMCLCVCTCVRICWHCGRFFVSRITEPNINTRSRDLYKAKTKDSILTK